MMISNLYSWPLNALGHIYEALCTLNKGEFSMHSGCREYSSYTNISSLL